MATRIELWDNLEEVLAGRPPVVKLFLDRRMACPGCAMAPFETLADAVRNYGLPDEEFLAEVRRAAEAQG
jgi:hybrid cluster-associated redox disulfide protein